MAGLFSKPKSPKIPEPPPSVDKEKAAELSYAAKRRERLRASSGSTQLSGRQMTQANVGTTQLLGR